MIKYLKILFGGYYEKIFDMYALRYFNGLMYDNGRLRQ